LASDRAKARAIHPGERFRDLIRPPADRDVLADHRNVGLQFRDGGRGVAPQVLDLAADVIRWRGRLCWAEYQRRKDNLKLPLWGDCQTARKPL